MNIKQLTNQIQREAKANPGRSSVLGIVLLVAIYFWAPLLMKWCGVGQAAVATPTAAEPVDVLAVVAESEGNDTLPEIAWKELRQAIERDPYMRSAQFLANWRDPLATTTMPAIDTEDNENQTNPTESIQTDKLRLELESTIVGKRRSVARINGKSYRHETGQKREIEIEVGGRTVVFNLTAVHRKQVTLEHQGKPFILSVKTEPLASASIERND